MKEQEAIAILQAVRARVGRQYKSMINASWVDGNYSRWNLEEWDGQLQNIRNTFGPSWLVKVKVAPALAGVHFIELKQDGNVVCRIGPWNLFGDAVKYRTSELPADRKNAVYSYAQLVTAEEFFALVHSSGKVTVAR